MKKIISLLFAFILAFSATVSAESVINVTVDGKIIAFSEYPVIENGRTLVPLRKIFEELGATVSWDSNTKTAISEKNGTVVKVQIDSANMYVNNAIKQLDVPAKLINDKTYVPARAIAEAYGCRVSWDEANKVVIIKNSEYLKKENSFIRHVSETNKYIISYNPAYTLQTSGIEGVSQSDFLLTDPNSLSFVNVTAIKNETAFIPTDLASLKHSLEEALGMEIYDCTFSYRNYMPSVSFEYYIGNMTVMQTIYYTNSFIYTVTLALTETVSAETISDLKYTLYSLNV